MGPETGFGFLRKEIDDFCGIAMATSIGLEVEDRGLGMVEAKRLEQAMGEVNHKEGETSGIGDRGRLDGHKVFESPELFSIAEIKFNLKAQAVIVHQHRRRQGQVAAEEDDMGSDLGAQVDFF